MNRSDLSFWKVFRHYLKEIKGRLFSLTELVIVALITVASTFMVSHSLHPADLTQNVASWLFAASATIMGILIAGFAIYATVADREFILSLQRSGTLQDLMFPFWLGCILWFISMGMSYLCGLGSNVLNRHIAVLDALMTATFFLSLTFTISVVGSTFRLAVYRALFLDAEDDH